MIQIQSLRDCLDHLGEDFLSSLFQTFKCELDDEIQNFLSDFAIEYETRNICRTFFVMDDECPGEILGYFSIGLNVLHFAQKINVPDAYEGICLCENGYRPIFKLFMIGKNDSCSKKVKMSNVFNNTILEYFNLAKSLVGGDLLYIDCIPELREYYEKLGFAYFDEMPEYELIRMIRSV